MDYRPTHNFWLFSFERFNGVLEDFKTNQRAVEIQIMRKFLRDQDIRDLPFPSQFKYQLEPVFSQMKNSVMSPIHDISSAAKHFSLSQGSVTKTNLWFDTASFPCISPRRMDYLDDDELNCLMHSYSAFIEGVEFQSGSATFDRYAGVEFLVERYGSLDSRSKRSSFIASWVGENGNIDLTTCNIRPGVVSY